MTEAPEGYGAPLVSVDVVPVALGAAGRPVVRLPRRRFDPYAGDRALPGVLLMDGERLHEAALRALQTKARILQSWVTGVHQVRTFDTPGRDQRGPTISVAYVATVRAATAGPGWAPLNEAPAMPFDHGDIVEHARGFLLDRLWLEQGTLVKAMLGSTFTTAAAADLLDGLYPASRTVDRTNLPRFLKSQPFLHQTTAKGQPGSRGGRPAAVWAFASVASAAPAST